MLAAVSGDYGKPRPFLVVQADDLTGLTDSVLACPMTSKVKGASFRVTIAPDADTGLKTTSEVMVEKLLSFRQERVRAVVGRIPAEKITDLDIALLTVLGLRR